MTMAASMKPSLADAIQMLGRTYRNKVQASFVLCMEGIDIVTSYRYEHATPLKLPESLININNNYNALTKGEDIYTDTWFTSQCTGLYKVIQKDGKQYVCIGPETFILNGM